METLEIFENLGAAQALRCDEHGVPRGRVTGGVTRAECERQMVG